MAAGSPRPATARTIDIFDAAHGRSDHEAGRTPGEGLLARFLDSQHLATGGTDDRITIWDLDSKEAASQLVGHTGTVAALACDATGNVLVSGSYDTTLCIWNLAERARTGHRIAHAKGCVSLTALRDSFDRHECTEAARGNIQHTSRFVSDRPKSPCTRRVGSASNAKKAQPRRAPLPDRRARVAATYAGDVEHPHVVLGSVYFEEDSGDDSQPDTIHVSFNGGAAGTTLNKLTINGDKRLDGLTDGDVFFDTAPGGLGRFNRSR